ncbi:molybdopterin synthase catalytic subunit MoaE [Pigmentiphaga soli]|uniref:Molybdopterin synthase catalytic subunit n=1 Tax=Pigmentiphaga soli TaxID=1007095 RepID=A0ABP8H8F3_9BURK
MTARISVSVQANDFDTGAELAALRDDPAVGAIASFIGTVRDINAGADVSALTLEHYPGMTEKALEEIAAQAGERWPIDAVRIIHRVGALRPRDQIVLVAVSGRHRREVFDACAFVMDYLKTEAPFWKKEVTPEGERWVEARDEDEAARARWEHGE